MDQRRNETGPAPRRGIGCLLALMGLLAGLGFVGITAAGLVGGGGAGAGIVETVERSEPGATQKLVIIDVRGTLMSGSVGGGGLTPGVLAMLDRAAEDESVAGVLLRVDTPGGSVTDADLIHHRIERLKKKGRKVLVHMGDLCASGGYYLAVAADEIWALPTTVTGSIGVIISNLEVGGLLDRVGVTDDSIASGANKQILSPFKPLTGEQRALLQGLVDQMYQRFLEVIAAGRTLEIDTFRGLADGRLLTAVEAETAGLIDRIGYHRESLTRLGSMVGEGPFTVVRYAETPSLGDLLRARAQGSAEARVLDQLFAAPRAMYLFAPGAMHR